MTCRRVRHLRFTTNTSIVGISAFLPSALPSCVLVWGGGVAGCSNFLPSDVKPGLFAEFTALVVDEQVCLLHVHVLYSPGYAARHSKLQPQDTSTCNSVLWQSYIRIQQRSTKNSTLKILWIVAAASRESSPIAMLPDE